MVGNFLMWWCEGECKKMFVWHFVYAMEFGYTIYFQFVTPRHPARIDTWNREKMNISHPTRFVPGPVPRTFSASVGNQIYHVLKVQIKVHHSKPLWIDMYKACFIIILILRIFLWYLMKSHDRVDSHAGFAPDFPARIPADPTNIRWKVGLGM